MGGVSSRLRRLDLADGRALVLREVPRPDDAERDIRREAAALALASPVRRPTLVAADPDSGRSLATWVDGTWSIDADEVRHRAPALAELSRAIAATPLPNEHGLAAWETWFRPPGVLPTWSTRPTLWHRAFELAAQWTPPPHDPVLIHRDLHPMNVLWHDDDPAVLDWVQACVGHPHAELAHTRWNLTLLADVATGDDFVAAAAGNEIDPMWDVIEAVEFAPEPFDVSAWQAGGRVEISRERAARVAEDFLERALQRLA